MELGEIEAVIKQAHKQIRQAAVLVHTDDGVQRVVAYLLVDADVVLDIDGRLRMKQELKCMIHAAVVCTISF